MTIADIEKMLDRALKRPLGEVLALPENSRVAYYKTQLERPLFLSWEEISTLHRLGLNSENFGRIEKMPVVVKLKELDILTDQVFKSLSAKQQAILINEYDSRMSGVIDPWRREHGFLTDDEMNRAIKKYGDQAMIGGSWVVLRKSEVPQIESLWQALAAVD